MPSQEVVLKKVPALPVASLRDIAPAYSAVGQFLGEVFAHLSQHRLSPAGPPMSIYHDHEYREKDVDVEAVVPVVGTIPDGERVKARELPAAEMACIIHQGTYDDLGGTYGQLMGWVETNGYRIAGPIREVYMHWQEDDPSGNVTEIQFPVEKA